MDIETLITDLQVGGEKLVYYVEEDLKGNNIFTFALQTNYSSYSGLNKYNHKLHCMKTFKADTLRTALNMYIKYLKTSFGSIYKVKSMQTGNLIERV